MAYIDLYNLANGQEFYARVKMACYTAAVAIVGESRTTTVDGNTVTMSEAKANKRHTLAYSILQQADVSNFCYAILAFNPSITSASSDNDLQFLVNSVFNDVAGVTYEENIPVAN